MLLRRRDCPFCASETPQDVKQGSYPWRRNEVAVAFLRPGGHDGASLVVGKCGQTISSAPP